MYMYNYMMCMYDRKLQNVWQDQVDLKRVKASGGNTISSLYT